MKQWRFVSNQNSMISGINDAGIETFTADMNRSLVREIIQNSLDAVREDNDEPVRVEFEMIRIKREDIPDVNTLQSAIKKCYESNADEPDAFRFFSKADETLNQEYVNVLRISDYNTKGLEGSDTCEKGSNWSRLVKENGSSNKGQSSGGSFGIGKSATFACSDLRTVFYSSLDIQGLASNFGVARLVSFNDSDLGWTTGVGYYSEDDRFVAIPELISFSDTYKRTETGTDIYILGMFQSQNHEKEFIEAVLLDFLVSLVKGKLVVDIQGKRLSKHTLPEYISRLNPYQNEDIKALIEYYNLLTSSNPKIKKISLDSNVYGKEFGFKDGECILYLKEDEKLNRKVLITRKAGMRILEQNRISGSIEFTGVLIMDGDNMNKTFKVMEVPSHDAWEPGRCRDNKSYYEKVLKGFRKYIKDCVHECFGKIDTDTMDAIGANDFLPDKIEDNDEPKLVKNDLTSRIKRLFGKSVEPTKKKTKALKISEIEADGDEKGGSGPGDGEGPPPGTGPHPGPKPGPFPGEEDGENRKTDEKGKQATYKEISVKKRLISTERKEGKYRLSFFSPVKASKAKLVFSVAGEQSDFELPIKTAEIVAAHEETEIEKVESNTIYLNNMKKGESICIEIKVDFDSYCMMEVDYYAYKK